VAQGVGPEFKPQYHKKKRGVENQCREFFLHTRLPNKIRLRLGISDEIRESCFAE
jgi:hypothetical protein